MEASIDGIMIGVISLDNYTAPADSVTITSMSAGTATLEAKYNGYSTKAMVMVKTTGQPTPPASDIPNSTGKLVLNPRLTILDLNTKPSATVTAYYENNPVDVD